MDGLVDAGFIVLGGPLADEVRTAHAVQAESVDEIRATLARDPWSETHLQVDTSSRGRSGSTGGASKNGGREGPGPQPAGPTRWRRP